MFYSVFVLIPIYALMMKPLKGKWRGFAVGLPVPIFLAFRWSSIYWTIHMQLLNPQEVKEKSLFNIEILLRVKQTISIISIEKIPYLPLMKKLNQDTVHLYTRNVSANNLKVQGADNLIWSNQYVIFQSPYNEDIKVEFR